MIERDDDIAGSAMAEMGEELSALRAENEQLKLHAALWCWLRDSHHVRGHSPHMDGTMEWRLAHGLAGRYATFEEAAYQAMTRETKGGE